MDSNMPTWMSDPLVKDIPKEKLTFLRELFEGGKGKSQKEMMMYMMPMMKKAKQLNLTFNNEELNAAITAIKKHSTQEELNKINDILNKTNKNG